MKFKYLFFSILVFGIISCYTNKQLTSELHYLKSSEKVVMEFYKTYGGEDVVYPKVEFNRLKRSRRVIKFEVFYNQNFKYENKVFIKPFKALPLNTKRLFSDWATEYDDSKNGEDLYYKMVNYWLLPHKLFHKLKLKENIGVEDWKEICINIEKNSLFYIVSKGYSKQFKDFSNLIRKINLKTKSILQLNETDTFGIKDVEKKDYFFYYLHYKTDVTLHAFEKINEISLQSQ